VWALVLLLAQPVLLPAPAVADEPSGQVLGDTYVFGNGTATAVKEHTETREVCVGPRGDPPCRYVPTVVVDCRTSGYTYVSIDLSTGSGRLSAACLIYVFLSNCDGTAEGDVTCTDLTLKADGTLTYDHVAGASETTVTGTLARSNPQPPGSPQGLSAAADDNFVNLTWAAPADDGGQPIKFYVYYESFVANDGTTTWYWVAAVDGTTFNGYPITRLCEAHGFRVQAWSEVDYGPYSSVVEATGRPKAFPPENLAASTGAGAGEIDLTWDPPYCPGQSPTTNYRIYRGPNNDDTETFLTQVGNVTSFTDTGLPAGATRYYKVSAVNALGEGLLSWSTGGTTLVGASAPTDLAASRGSGAGEILVTWQGPADTHGSAVTNYRVYRGSSAGTEAFLTQLGNVTSFTDTGLPNGATRYYEVSAVNAAGEGTLSGEVSASTPDVPTAPLSLAASRGPGAGQISLTWQAPSDNGGLAVTNYKVYRGTSSGSLSFLQQVGNVLRFIDSGLPSGATRYYGVSAVTAAGEGTRSGEVSASAPDVPSAPRSPAASRGPGAGEITLSWQAPSSDGGLAVSSYRVYRGTSAGGESLLQDVGNVLSFRDSGIPNGAVRYYKVSAVNGAGEGSLSVEVSAAAPVLPSQPQSFAASRGPSAGQITLTWQAPADNGGSAVSAYRVYRGDTSGSEGFLQQVGSVLGFTDSGLPNGVTRCYEVSAVNAVGEGPRSVEQCAFTSSPPGPPQALAAAPALAFAVLGTSVYGGVALHWQAPADDGGAGITNYQIWAGASPGAETLRVTVGNVLSYTDNHADLLRPNYYYVRAVNAVGAGPGSNEACGYTYPWLPPLHPPLGQC
jgi:fibronectin type 3 domain-containing protein